MAPSGAAAVILAPLSGTVRDLAEVPDDVFAQQMVGPGVAIEPVAPGRESPEQIEVRAPVAGIVTRAHPHAVVVEFTADGAVAGSRRGVLVHLGIDTVRLQGRGFTPQVDQGQQVAAGELLSRWSVHPARDAGYALISPVLALGASAEEVALSGPPGRYVEAGQELFRWR